MDIDVMPVLQDYTSAALTASEVEVLSQFKEPVEAELQPALQQYSVPHTGRECRPAAVAQQDLKGCMAVRVAPDHAFISLGTRDGRIHVFRPPEQKAAGKSTEDDLREMYCLEGCSAATVSYGNIPGSAHAPSEAVHQAQKAPISALAWRTPTLSSQNVVLAGQGNQIRGYHVTTGRQVSSATIPPSEQGQENILSLRVSPGGDHVAVGGSHGGVHLFDSRGAALEENLQFGQLDSAAGVLSSTTGHGHTSRVFALHWSDNNLLFSGGWDNTVQMWDIRVRRSVRSIFGPHICGNGIAQIGSVLVTAAWSTSNPLQLWDIGSGSLLTNLPVHGADAASPLKLYAVAVSRQGHIVAGGSSNTPGARVITVQGQTVGTLHTSAAVHDIDILSCNGKDYAMMCYGDTLAAVPV